MAKSWVGKPLELATGCHDESAGVVIGNTSAVVFAAGSSTESELVVVTGDTFGESSEAVLLDVVNWSIVSSKMLPYPLSC